MSDLAVEMKPKGKITSAEMQRRREGLRRADAHNRIEGQFPSPNVTPFSRLLFAATLSKPKSYRVFMRCIASCDLCPVTLYAMG